MSNISDTQSLQLKALAALNNRAFELILFPTEKCNFRCTYCYEDFNIGKMSRPTINGVKSLLDSKFKVVRYLNVDWFGGEPLLALPIVEEISQHILYLTETYENVVYSASMTTNAYLLQPATAERLVSLGITRYQISLDGDEDAHNSTRRMLNGGNSFERIWQNLIRIHQSDYRIEILLRIHLSRDNIESVEGLLERVVVEFGGDPRFKIFLRRLDRLGGPNDASLPILTEDEETRVTKRLIESISSKMTVFNLAQEADPTNYVCYASKANSLAIRADGSVAKCTVALYDERNRIGKLQENGTVLIDRERLLPWLRGLESLNPDELACPYNRMA